MQVLENAGPAAMIEENGSRSVIIASGPMPQTEDKSIGPALLEKWALGYLERFASSAENLRRRGPQGQWLPGSSPNPGGRPKIIEDIRDLAREHTETAINTLVQIAESGN